METYINANAQKQRQITQKQQQKANHRNKQTNKQINKQKNKQTNTKTGKQTNKQKNKQIKRLRNKQMCLCIVLIQDNKKNLMQFAAVSTETLKQ